MAVEEEEQGAQASNICSVQNGYKPCKLNQSPDSFDLYSHTADWPWSA